MTEKGNPFGETKKEKEFYKKGLKDGSEHSLPSPITKEFMDETKVTMATLVERVTNVIDLIKTNHEENKTDHQGIMARQDHTNGDVTTLKTDVVKLQNWKAYLIGAWAVITFVSTFLVPALFYLYIENLKYEMGEATKDIITEEISQYIEKIN